MSVLVFAENWEGKHKKSTFEAVTYGKDLATAMGKDVVAVSIGSVDDNELAGLGKYGASKVLKISGDKLTQFALQAMASAMEQAAKATGAAAIVFSNSFTAKAVSSRLAIKLNASQVTGVVELPKTDQGFVVKKSAFSGKGFAYVALNNEIKILSLTPNSYKVTESGSDCPVESLDVTINDDDFKCESKDVSEESSKLSVTDADIVVSGGRGLKGPENWGMIEELAELLGAATACSKPVSDSGWRGHDEHVGQTGKTIGPNLYIAIAISGAIQHLAGVNASKVKVVINKDPEAPFFKAADYGIIGDAFEVVPKLIEEIKEHQSTIA
ncbi:electron transfer flavoprotein subunit alpha/FixB family protein [bacterium AH-315-C07]|nr:electron transfer flavoprotein subunit alpha/FixB family protein [bacterium AH-315-C07]